MLRQQNGFKMFFHIRWLCLFLRSKKQFLGEALSIRRGKFWNACGCSRVAFFDRGGVHM